MQPHGEVALTRKGNLACLTLNRPSVLNALDREMLMQLSAHLDDLKGDGACQAVIITGFGQRAFSAGADIRYLRAASPPEVRELARLAVHVNHQLETLGKVVIAAINGHALGGGLELAEACTLRVAARHAQLGHPEVRIGAVAGWGGTTRLSRLIGRGRAAELLLTGRVIGAEQAQAWGLVNEVVAPGELPLAAERLADEVLAQSPVAVRLTWEALHRGGNLSVEESALLGADYFGLAAATEDFRSGTAAFLAMKPPRFQGH